LQAESTLEWRAGHSGPGRGHDGCRRAQEAGGPTALVKAEPWSDVHGTAQYGQAAYGASGGLSRSLAFRSLRARLDAAAAAAHYRRSQNRERKSGDGTSQRRRRGSQPALVISYIQPRAFETCASPAVTQKQHKPSSWRRVIICWEGEAYDRGNTAEGLQPQKPHHSTSALKRSAPHGSSAMQLDPRHKAEDERVHCTVLMRPSINFRTNFDTV
jgi:hypothetical protein